MSLLRAVLDAGGSRRAWSTESIIPSAGAAYWGTNGSNAISQDQAAKILAIYSCVSLLADTISTLPAGAFDKVDDTRIEVKGPGWLSLPIPDDPNETWEDHVSQLVWSQELDGNSFTLALPDVFDPAELRVVNPQKVTIRKRGQWDINMADGRETVGPDQLIHIARNRRPGLLRAASAVEEGGTSFAMKRAAERFSAKVFNNAVFLSGQLVLPGPALPAAITQIKDELAAQYGPENAGKPGVFANGAKWDVPHMNLQEMQLVELHKYAKLEAAGLFRVPPYLIGVVDPGAMAYASVEAQGTDFEKYSIRPRIVRIERAYNRLIPGALTYLRLNTAGLLRADFKTRMEGHQVAIQSRIQTVDEVRALEDWAPFGEANGGGFVDTPNNTVMDPRYAAINLLVRNGFDPAAALAALGLPPILHTGLVSKYVQGENVATAGAEPALNPTA